MDNHYQSQQREEPDYSMDVRKYEGMQEYGLNNNRVYTTCCSRSPHTH